MHKDITLATLIALLSFLTVNVAAATLYVDESTFQSNEGPVVVENFEGFAAFDPVSSLPLLGGSFQVLNNGFLPVAYDQSSGGTVRSGAITLINNEAFALPGDGDLVFLAAPNTVFSAVAYWNTGANDTTRLSLFDSGDNLLATTVSGFGQVFIGIGGVNNAVRAVISAETGNGWFSIDDFQTAVSPVPVPASLILFASAIFGARRFARSR